MGKKKAYSRDYQPERRTKPEKVKPPKKVQLDPCLMYIEAKGDGKPGPARIGRVTYSRTSETLYYRGQSFQVLKGHGTKANYFDVMSENEYWISPPKADGNDRRDGGAGAGPVEIDDEVREEYWREIRQQPERAGEKVV